MVNIENSDLAKIGTATDILRELPRVDVWADGTVNVFAKGTPLIYINNKQVRSNTELEQLKSNEVKSVELITAPGAKYDATVQSVVRIKTIKSKVKDGVARTMRKHPITNIGLDTKIWNLDIIQISWRCLVRLGRALSFQYS